MEVLVRFGKGIGCGAVATEWVMLCGEGLRMQALELKA